MRARELKKTMGAVRSAMAKGKPERAAKILKPVLAKHPEALELVAAMVQVELRLGRYESARRRLAQLLKRDPSNRALHRQQARILNKLGLEALSDGATETARRNFVEAIEHDQAYDDARFNLALHRFAQGDSAAALQEFERLVNCDHASVLYHRARAHAKLGQVDLASDLMARAMSAPGLDGQRAVAFAVLADELSLPELAESMVDQAVRLGSDLGEVRLHRAGSILADHTRATPQRHAAITATTELMDDPGLAEAAATTLIRYHIECCDLRSARQLTHPGMPHRLLLQAHLGMPSVMPDVATIAKVRSEASIAAKELLDLASERITALDDIAWFNFYLPYQGRNDRTLQRAWAQSIQQQITSYRPQWMQFDSPRLPGAPRVGLVGRWGDNVVGHYFGSWAGALQKAGAETTLLTNVGTDRWTARLRDTVSSVVNLADSADDAAKQIRASDFDVLIYPELGHDHKLSALAACRLARKQLLAWGLPVTSGLDGIDGFISPSLMEPEGRHGQHYHEPLLELPEIGTSYPRPPEAPSISRFEFGLPNDKTLYLYPHSPFKIHPESDQVLADLLALDRKAVLVMVVTHDKTQWPRLMRRLRAVFTGRGIADPDQRLICMRPMSRLRYLALQTHCDVLLDTLHFSGGNTTLDALSTGLPVVTCEGEFMRGRQTSVMLKLVGRQDWVCDDSSRLARLAVDVAGQRIDRSRLRSDAHDALFERNGPLSALVEQVLGAPAS
ncbi:MAG: hypothetical protein DHS20C11_32190 [Lysobacteraceae bacterium]|nr:MAG: hypothetical protein DHS20C11_32190 [Xanthomonadaceae bacterium]